MSSIISVQLDELSALAAELSVLATDLHDDAQLCRSAVHPLLEALPGPEGATSAVTATVWSSLAAVVADRAGETAGALVAAIAAYRAADAALAGRMCPADPDFAPR